MDYEKPSVVTSYHVADLYNGASGFASAAPGCNDDPYPSCTYEDN